MLGIWNENNAKTQKWYRKSLDGCVGSNGKPYSITLKKGTAKKLLVNFVGGGLSWNEETAAKPISVSAMLRKKEVFYINGLSNTALNLMHIGILKADDKRNPFNDWSILNIPYTTADFHIGNNEYAYLSASGENKILYHHGEKNIAAALVVLRNFFQETPETILIMGGSAGAFGCVAHSPAIKNLYPDCENVIVYSEGSHIRSPLWRDIARDIWKVNENLAAYIESDDLIFDLFRSARDNMPSHTFFLHSNSVWDSELVRFTHKMYHGKLEVNSEGLRTFHDTLKDTVKKLKKEIPNYSYFLTDYGKKKDGSTPHIFIGSPKLFYGKIEDNLSIAEWLNEAVNKSTNDVGKKFIE
jgi:hypothetical protein